MDAAQEWFEFDRLIEPMPWGRSVYTILQRRRLLQPIEEAATEGTRRRRIAAVLDGLR